MTCTAVSFSYLRYGTSTCRVRSQVCFLTTVKVRFSHTAPSLAETNFTEWWGIVVDTRKTACAHHSLKPISLNSTNRRRDEQGLCQGIYQASSCYALCATENKREKCDKGKLCYMSDMHQNPVYSHNRMVIECQQTMLESSTYTMEDRGLIC